MGRRSAPSKRSAASVWPQGWGGGGWGHLHGKECNDHGCQVLSVLSGACRFRRRKAPGKPPESPSDRPEGPTDSGGGTHGFVNWFSKHGRWLSYQVGNRLTCFATNTAQGVTAGLELRHRCRVRCGSARARRHRPSAPWHLPVGVDGLAARRTGQLFRFRGGSRVGSSLGMVGGASDGHEVRRQQNLVV